MANGPEIRLEVERFGAVRLGAPRPGMLEAAEEDLPLVETEARNLSQHLKDKINLGWVDFAKEAAERSKLESQIWWIMPDDETDNRLIGFRYISQPREPKPHQRSPHQWASAILLRKGFQNNGLSTPIRKATIALTFGPEGPNEIGSIYMSIENDNFRSHRGILKNLGGVCIGPDPTDAISRATRSSYIIVNPYQTDEYIHEALSEQLITDKHVPALKAGAAETLKVIESIRPYIEFV